MSRLLECGDTKAMSPVYDDRPAALAARLSHEKPCRSVNRACAMRRASLRDLAGELTDSSGRTARNLAHAFCRWVEGLHRGPFSSTI